MLQIILFVATFLQIKNYSSYSLVAGVWVCYFLMLGALDLSQLLMQEALTPNEITGLPTLKHLTSREFVFWIENGEREENRKEGLFRLQGRD